MQRGWLIHAVRLRHRLPGCCYLPVSGGKCPFRVVPMHATPHHRKYCTRNAPKVVYDPKCDMSEEEVKHIKLEPFTEESGGPSARRYALLLSFNGQGYYGMQRNATGITIENHLLRAMLDAGLITQEEFWVPQLFFFQRASRTDKGVSAARLLVSGNFRCDKSEIKTKLNQRLNEQIRVMAAFRTTKTFSCKTWCDSRTYSYTCPTFAFASHREVVQDSYRLPEEALQEVRKLFAEYKGVLNFHNFTSGIKPWDPRATRRILDLECGEPFEQNGLQWITIRIKGISFLLHQIRKMIGLVIAIRQGVASSTFISQALSQAYASLPIAPGLGLVLEDQHFDNYNKKHARREGGARERISWETESEVIEEFRRKNIITPLMAAEVKERSMFQWLTSLPCYSFDLVTEAQKLTRDRSDGWYSASVPPLVLLSRLTHHMKDTDDTIDDVVRRVSQLLEDRESAKRSSSDRHSGLQSSPTAGLKLVASDCEM